MVWYAGTNILEKSAGFIFRADDGSRILQYTSIYLSSYKYRRVTVQRIAILKCRLHKSLEKQKFSHTTKLPTLIPVQGDTS
jgi:hypothetical protein